MLTEEQKQKLREKLGKKVTITGRCEYRTPDGYYNTEPAVKYKQYDMIFLGIYGVNHKPFFVLGNKESKEIIFRNVSWITWDEDTGITNFEYDCSIEKIDDIDISKAFETWTDRDSTIARLFGYRPETTISGIVNLNWGTSELEDKLEVVEKVKGLEKII